MTVIGENPGKLVINQGKERPTRPTLTEEDKHQLQYIPWGDSDDYPNNLDEKFRKIGVLQTAIDVNANIHYGQGIEWVKKEVSPEGKRTLVPQLIPEWDDWADEVSFNVTQGEIVYSLEYLGISFAEFVLNKMKDDIKSLQLLDTGSCRFAKRDSNGRIPNILFHSDFGKVMGNVPDPVPIPIYDPSKKIKDQPHKFVLPIFYRTLGNNFYPEMNIQSVIANGWADNAISVPQYISAIYKNQISPKYHVNIPFLLLLEFVGVKEDAWYSMDLKSRLDAKTKCKDWIDEQLTAEKNAGKTVVTFTIMDGQQEHKISIEPIESKQDSTKELPNGFAANSEILFATNTDPELIGLGIPGGKTLSGSGSGKREALLLAQSMRKREREVSLAIPRLCARIKREGGKFPSGISPTYVDMDISQTLDKNPTGKENKIN